MPTIRPLEQQDCQLLAALHSQCFPRGWQPHEFEAFFAGGNMLAYAIERNGSEAGFILCWLVAGQSELLAIGVLPEYRRQSLAQRLLRHALVKAKKREATHMFLEVGVNNHAARALYSNEGFEMTGRRKNYYRHPDGCSEDAVTMVCSL